MPTLGLSLTLLIGSTTPRPVPPDLGEAVDSLEITYQDQGQSGFQIIFRVGRAEPSDSQDDPLLRGSQEQLLRPFNRVIATVMLNSGSRVILDGFITHHEYSPSLEPGESTLTIMGEDAGVMMDLEEKSVEHLELSDQAIVSKLINSYSKYGLTPKLSTPQWVEQPLKTERVPVQLGTDLAYIRELADRHGFVFYITPGSAVGSNVAYWGPPNRKATPASRPLTFNMGSYTNVESINFRYNALAAMKVQGSVQDRKTNQVQPISVTSSRRSPLSREPALTNQTQTRTMQFRQTARLQTQADAYAQAKLDQATDSVLVVQGELDTLTYGDLLQRGETVDLRGVGHSYDGRYFINEVTHRISQGEYKQRFTLSREGWETNIASVTV